jgi:hypothetical protein
MQEIFYEESTILNNEKKESLKYSLIKTASIIAYILAAFWAYLIVNFLDLSSVFNIILVGVIPLAIFIFLGVFLGKIKDKFCVVYDYNFITGSIRISKVINNVKRKSVIKFECSDIEKVGKTNTDLFLSYYNQKNSGVEFISATSNKVPMENKQFYYIALNVASQKTLLLLECSKEFIMNVIKFSKRSVIDGELIK